MGGGPMSCPSCGHENPLGARFCNDCGARLAAASPLALEPRSYTPKHLAEKILTNRGAIEGERKQVTILFADVKGSTELASELDPKADWAHARDFYLVMTNAPGANAWPIAASTFVLMYKQPKNAAASASARKFFNWSLSKGQPQALSLDYVPLPAPLVKRIQSYVASSVR